MIAIQNPSAFTKGALQIVDAYYDSGSGYNGLNKEFPISGYSGALPVSIQNMPEEQLGAVYGSGDGSLALISYAKESSSGTAAHRALTQHLHHPESELRLCRQPGCPHAGGGQSPLPARPIPQPSRRLPRQREPRRVNGAGFRPEFQLRLLRPPAHGRADHRVLRRLQHLARAAMDCEPQNAPSWCLFQVQSPDNVDATGNYYGAPLIFDRPVKAVFSADGSTAYVLNCGPECGGSQASVSLLPVAPMIYLTGQASGLLPYPERASSDTRNSHPRRRQQRPGYGSTMYVVGQQPQPDRASSSPATYSGESEQQYRRQSHIHQRWRSPAPSSRMIQADDNTLWIGMTKCTNGERYAPSRPAPTAA